MFYNVEYLYVRCRSKCDFTFNQLSLNEDYRGAAKISSKQLYNVVQQREGTSRDFSAEIYVLHKDHGGNLGGKTQGKVMCTAIMYE